MRELIRGFLQDATQEEVPKKLLLDRVMESIKEYANQRVIDELENIEEKAKGLRYEDKHDLVLKRIKELKQIKWEDIITEI